MRERAELVEVGLARLPNTVKVYVQEGPDKYGTVLIDWEPSGQAEMHQGG